MTKKDFNLPPLSPLIGATLLNYIRVTRGKEIESKYLFKYILTGAIITALTPLRWLDHLHYQRIKSKPIASPIFILGHWRSGTTFLHNVLCQADHAGFVTTYQTVFSHFMKSKALLKPFMQWVMPEKRPGDNVLLHPWYPQEEEFALSNMTDLSYYHYFYFPAQYRSYFDRTIAMDLSEKEHSKLTQRYLKLLRIALDQQPNASHLVLKNPVNTGRVKWINQTFPNARYIHIYRNPFAVFLSTKKFFTELMPTLWLKSISEEQIETLILENYIRLYDCYYSHEPPKERLFKLRFEDFESDPLLHIERMYSFFNLPDFNRQKARFKRYLETKKTYRKNTHVLTHREYALIQEKWGKYLNKWEYTLPDNIKLV
jgi:hypothetical protein